MYNPKFLAASLAFAGAFVVPGRTNAQNGTPPPQTPTARVGRQERTQMRRRSGPSLADILEKVDWDPAARGVLLIVAPEETTHTVAPKQPRTSEEFRIVQEPPEAEANGSYRLSRVEKYYNRRVVNLRSLSVFAPATMSFLNSTRLPKPSAYAGMSSADKARLLESTFTPDQWRQIASAEGIGAGNLTRDQHDLFLSMLPEPFVVDAPPATTVAQGDGSRTEPPPLASLTGDQREVVRLSLQRSLDWQGKIGAKGRAYLGPNQPDTTTAQQPRLDVPPPPRFGPTNEVFGVKIVEEVPSRLKPSQLPDDWEALDKQIDLGKAATIGDLVREIVKETGAELYCDPRYEDRKLYVRGTSAQADDICRALAWGVTGTWRRLDKAFVLTDDLVGLGVRHALIDNWVRQNTLLAEVRNKKVNDALKSSHFADYVGWSAGDPTTPNDALRAKIAANDKAAEADPTNSLFVPVGELSPEAQATIRQEMASYEVNRGEIQKIFPDRPGQDPVDTSGVYLSVSFRAEYQVPGVGSVQATDLGSLSPRGNVGFHGASGIVNYYSPRSGGVRVAPVPPAIAFPPALADRVLLVSPKDDGDLAKLARAAHRGGFTQLWVTTERGDTRHIGAAIQVGAANGLRVQAVVSLMRPAPADKPEWQERTILGETLTGYAKRWRNQLADLRLPEDLSPGSSPGYIVNQDPTAAWGKEEVVARMLRGGDFLRCDYPAAIHQIGDDVSATAAVSGLGGVIFRDIAAPGFNAPLAPGINLGMSDNNPGADPLLNMGYSDATRLACLRKEGFDPVDLSPLSDGERVNIPYGLNRSGPPPEISLPFFSDYGTMPLNSSFNGQSRTTVGTKDAWERWCAFRQDLDAKFVASVAASVRVKSPSITLMSRRTMGALDDDWIFYSSLDGPVDASTAAAAATKTATVAPRPRDPVENAVRAASRTSYISLKYDTTLDTEEATKRFVSQLTYSLKNAASWDGIVVDLADTPLSKSLELLSAFPEASVPIREAKP